MALLRRTITESGEQRRMTSVVGLIRANGSLDQCPNLCFLSGG